MKEFDKRKLSKYTKINAELDKYNAYSPEEVYELLLKLVKEAEELGYTDCTLRFESQEDLYNDCTKVTVVGYQLETAEEQARRLDRAFTERYAALKGITFFEATTVLDLQKRGKL